MNQLVNQNQLTSINNHKISIAPQAVAPQTVAPPSQINQIQLKSINNNQTALTINSSLSTIIKNQ